MRPVGSENRAQKESDPYRMLSCRVLTKTISDKSTKYLRGDSDDLRFWLYCCDIDFNQFHKQMLKRFPRKNRSGLNCPVPCA